MLNQAGLSLQSSAGDMHVDAVKLLEIRFQLQAWLLPMIHKLYRLTDRPSIVGSGIVMLELRVPPPGCDQTVK